MPVQFTTLDCPVGVLRLAATDVGVCGIGFENESEETFRARCLSLSGDAEASGESPVLDMAVEQLTDYFEGRLKQFHLPLHVKGTEFQKSVWATLATIPYGSVMTYSEVAERVGKPLACRAVGAANAHNPVPIVVPCHRVVGSSGKLVGFGGGLDVKRWLLAHEGWQTA